MKRPYLHTQEKLQPFTVYSAVNLFDINNLLGDKKTVNYTKLKTGKFLVWFKE